jgi:hypothetical protein
MNNFEDLASKGPFGDGRVHLGFAFDGMWLPKDMLVPLFAIVKDAGVETIMTDYVRTHFRGSLQHWFSLIQNIANHIKTSVFSCQEVAWLWHSWLTFSFLSCINGNAWGLSSHPGSKSFVSSTVRGQLDPLAAIVLHSSPADIETMIIDGVVKKRHWMLEDVGWANKIGERLSWKDISRKLVKKRVEIQKKAEKLDMDTAMKAVVKSFYIDEWKDGSIYLRTTANNTPRQLEWKQYNLYLDNWSYKHTIRWQVSNLTLGIFKKFRKTSYCNK